MLGHGWHSIEADVGTVRGSDAHWQETLDVEFGVELARLDLLLAKHAEFARLFPETER